MECGIEVCLSTVVSFVTCSAKEQCFCEWWFLLVVYQWLPAVLKMIVLVVLRLVCPVWSRIRALG